MEEPWSRSHPTPFLPSASLLLSASLSSSSGAIKHKLRDPLGRLDNWNKGDPCSSNWTGIIYFEGVSNDGYLHVQELQLLNKNLSGTLAPELGQLSQLQIFVLNRNKLSGSLPPELGYLSKLNRLQIDQNYISGQVPATFSNLQNVRHLHMNNNSLSGSIPPQLSKLSLLLHFQFDNNNLLEGEIPASYGNITGLVKLSIGNNLLTGSVHASIWKNMAFDSKSELLLDFQNNLLSNVSGDLNSPPNVTL